MAGAVAALPQRRRAEPKAPEGAGRDLLLQACVQCHDLQILAEQRKTPAAWRRTVDEMIWKGAPLMADEVDVLAKYLAAVWGGPPGPQPAPRPASAASPTKTDAGQGAGGGRGRPPHQN